MDSDSLQQKYLEARKSDAALSQLIAGNPFKRLVFAVIRRTLEKYSSKQVDAEEIENIYGQVVYKLTHSLIYLKKVVVNFPSYVSRSASNQTIDYLRVKKLAFANVKDNPGHALPQIGKWIVERAINLIRKEHGDKTAQIAYLRINEELTFREIAEIMEMKKSTVADQFKKARAIILQQMEFYK